MIIWKATLDENTCQICMILHGKSLPDVAGPPALDCKSKLKCRCTTLLEIQDDKLENLERRHNVEEYQDEDDDAGPMGLSGHPTKIDNGG